MRYQRQNIGKLCREHYIVNKGKNNFRKFMNLLAIVTTASLKNYCKKKLTNSA